MIPLPEDISKKDVNQWLSGGWFYFKGSSGTYQIGKLAGVDEAQSLIHTQTPMGDVEIVPFANVYPHWPECGAANLKELKCAVSLTRLQKKQWRRTYTSDCLKLRVLSDDPTHFSGINPDYPSVIAAAFEPEYFTFSDVLKFKFKDGWKSCAISPSLIVMRPENSPSLTVFLNSEIIGMIDDGRFTCVNPSIKRRLLPYFDYMVE